jgi:hypothetical protein
VLPGEQQVQFVLAFIVRNGRALVYPVYKGTFMKETLAWLDRYLGPVK